MSFTLQIAFLPRLLTVMDNQLFCWSTHCYKYKLTKSGSGEFLATQLQEQDLNSAIKHLQEQELKKIQYLFLHSYDNVPAIESLKTPQNQIS